MRSAVDRDVADRREVARCGRPGRRDRDGAAHRSGDRRPPRCARTDRDADHACAGRGRLPADCGHVPRRQVTRPDPARQSRALVGTIVFAVAVAAFSRVPLLPDIGRALSLTAGELGLLTTAFGIGRLVMDLPAGRLAGVVDPAAALAGSGLGLAVACAILAASQTLLEALAGSALIGCA